MGQGPDSGILELITCGVDYAKSDGRTAPVTAQAGSCTTPIQILSMNDPIVVLFPTCFKY